MANDELEKLAIFCFIGLEVVQEHQKKHYPVEFLEPLLHIEIGLLELQKALLEKEVNACPPA